MVRAAGVVVSVRISLFARVFATATPNVASPVAVRSASTANFPVRAAWRAAIGARPATRFGWTTAVVLVSRFHRGPLEVVKLPARVAKVATRVAIGRAAGVLRWFTVNCPMRVAPGVRPGGWSAVTSGWIAAVGRSSALAEHTSSEFMSPGFASRWGPDFRLCGQSHAYVQNCAIRLPLPAQHVLRVVRTGCWQFPRCRPQ